MMRKKLLILFLGVLLWSACSKDFLAENGSRQAWVNVTLKGTEYDVSDLNTPNSHKAATSRSSRKQTNMKALQVLPFADGLSITAELCIDTLPEMLAASRTKVSNQGSKGSEGARAAIERSPIDRGIQYKVLVYHQGIFVDERLVIHGEESQMKPFELDGGETYTFLAYSLNSSVTLPEVSNKMMLDQVALPQISQDLMWLKQDFTPSTGANNLAFVLKHAFSQITVHIAPGDYGGMINSVINPELGPSSASASLRFADGKIHYSTLTEKKKIIFANSDIKAATWVSQPVLMIAPSTEEASLSIENLSINELSKPFHIHDLKIQPGKKYNLFLTMNAPCTRLEQHGEFWISGGDKKTFNIPSSSYGITFDVWNIANSLNFIVNGKPLMVREVTEERNTGTSHHPNWVEVGTKVEPYDFQFLERLNPWPAVLQNVRFKSDKARWGVPATSSTGNNVNFIYEIKGTEERPMLRLQLLPNGEVKLFGSRVSYGPLEELEIIYDDKNYYMQSGTHIRQRYKYKNYINPDVAWKTSGLNEVTVIQTVTGTTRLYGSVYSRVRVKCNP